MRDRILSMLSGVFALLGLLLAAIGLYGVMAYTVARRTSEIGIRMALGAEARQIGGMVIREALALIAGGVAHWPRRRVVACALAWTRCCSGSSPTI